MNKRNIIITIIVIVILAILVLLVLYMKNQKKYHPKYNWGTRYKTSKSFSKEPYGLYYFKNLLEFRKHKGEIFELNEPIKKKLGSTTQGNYLFVGAELYLNVDDQDSLLSFVREGNNAFISTEVVPEDLIYSISNWPDYYAPQINFLLKKSVKLTVDQVDKDFIFEHAIIDKATKTEWNFFGSYFNDSVIDFQVLGNMENMANFISIPYGNGNFFIHTTPLAFTNYFIIEPQGFEYADVVLKYIAEGDIYVDEFSKIDYFSKNTNNKKLKSSAILSFIYDNPGLKYGLYLLIITAILYIIFRSKRRQRPIPVIEPNTNTSLEYIQTVGRIYFKQKDHLKIAVLMRQLFFFYVWQKYNLSMKKIDDQLIEKIVERSHVDKAHILSIFEEINVINKQPTMESQQLEIFYKKLNYFYNHCK